MSFLTYIASDYPLQEISNLHDRLLSVNEALALGVEGPNILLAPDFYRDKPGVLLCSDREVVFDIDKGEIRDGALDDDFALLNAAGMDDLFTEKKYAVYLEWNGYMEGRARRIIEYIRENLRNTNKMEIWRLWMDSGEKPLIRSRTIAARELMPEDIKALLDSNVTEAFHEIPIQYRLVITAG